MPSCCTDAIGGALTYVTELHRCLQRRQARGTKGEHRHRGSFALILP